MSTNYVREVVLIEEIFILSLTKTNSCQNACVRMQTNNNAFRQVYFLNIHNALYATRVLLWTWAMPTNSTFQISRATIAEVIAAH